MAQPDNQSYNYKDAGFSAFMRRSIDNPRNPVTSLKDYARTAQQQSRAINFDNAPVSGQLSDITKVGDKITLDGTSGRISIFDATGNEVGRIGSLTDG